VAKLPVLVSAPREDPAIPPKGEAVQNVGRHAAHPNPGHGDRRCWAGGGELIAVARCFTLAARQQPAGRIHEQSIFPPRRDGRGLPAAALPRASAQVCRPRLGAAGWAHARNPHASWKGKLQQRRDHRRLGRKLRRLQPAVAVAQPLARLSDVDKVTEGELQAHARQNLNWEVQQGDAVGEEPAIGAVYFGHRGSFT
jgi:hypothetical protein